MLAGQHITDYRVITITGWSTLKRVGVGGGGGGLAGWGGGGGGGGLGGGGGGDWRGGGGGVFDKMNTISSDTLIA